MRSWPIRLLTSGLLTLLAACEASDRPVRLPGKDQGLAIDLAALTEARGRPAEAQAGVGDPTTCLLLDGKGTGYCAVATVYPGPLAFECTGEGSCSVTVTAPRGTELCWKSSCGGYAYSVVDGAPDTIGFDCSGAEQVMESITCTFQGASSTQSCTTSGLPGPFRCSGTGSCQVYVLTRKGRSLSWTSSCGGSATTVVDGATKEISFSCP